MKKIIIHGPHLTISTSRDMHAPIDRRETVIVEGEMRSPSDGYHTFDELYEHRIILYIALCAMRYDMHLLSSKEVPHGVWRSKLHSDGSKYDGCYILGIGKEKGSQITYHLPEATWEQTSFAETLEKAPEFDGHTSADVLNRIVKL